MKKKTPKSIVISYRLSPEIIAKAIDGLKQYDKAASIDTLAGICKQTMLHGVNYLTQGLPFEPSRESLAHVYGLTLQGKKNKPNIEKQILSSQLKFPIPQAKYEEIITGSEKKIVSDWSVPEELREVEEEE